jgi:hypothetical protein
MQKPAANMLRPQEDYVAAALNSAKQKFEREARSAAERVVSAEGGNLLLAQVGKPSLLDLMLVFMSAVGSAAIIPIETANCIIGRTALSQLRRG